MPRHQKPVLKDLLAAIGNIINSGHLPLSMHIRHEINEERCATRNAHCAAQALERALKGNLGRSVSVFYKNLLDENLGKFSHVLLLLNNM